MVEAAPEIFCQKPRRPLFMLLIDLIHECLDFLRHAGFENGTGLIDAVQFLGIAEFRFDLFGLHTDHTGNRKHFPLNIEGNKAAPIPTCKEVAFLFQRSTERFGIIGKLPRLLETLFDLSWIEFQAFGLLPS